MNNWAWGNGKKYFQRLLHDQLMSRISFNSLKFFLNIYTMVLTLYALVVSFPRSAVAVKSILQIRRTGDGVWMNLISNLLVWLRSGEKWSHEIINNLMVKCNETHAHAFYWILLPSFQQITLKTASKIYIWFLGNTISW